MYAIDRVRRAVRSWLKQLAKLLDTVSRSKITPNQLTISSTLAHILVALAIIDGRLVLAAAGLVIFGLMDALDGELARLQNRQTSLGIVLDAVSDRIKETIIYMGITVYFVNSGDTAWLFWAPLALGTSISLSYIKAKGEAVLASTKTTKLDPQALNRFTGGETLMQFDVRMAIIVVGLLFNYLQYATAIIAVMSLFSIISRYNELKHILEN